jgi:hypothetical protein
MSFKRLHHECFNRQHDRDEGQSISEDARDVEQLKRHADLKSNAVGPTEEFDDEHDFPDQRQPRAGRGRKVGRKLRKNDMAYASHNAMRKTCAMSSSRDRAIVRLRGW